MDFFINEDNQFGKTYKIIYKQFIKQQNENLERIMRMKNDICKIKIDVQQITEKEIFNLNLDKNISFIDILFNSSYRKILDTIPIRYNSYREYAINYSLIEEIMTDSLLKNKKLLTENITEFFYNNELFNNQITNLLSLFKKRYKCKNIIPSDKVIIYKFCINNKNVPLFKNIINDFIVLIHYLNDQRKEANNKNSNINEESKIYEVLGNLGDLVSNNFMKIFENQDGLTVDKISEIFEYYLKIIYDDISLEIKKYQTNLGEKSKEAIKKYDEKEKKHIISKRDLAYSIRKFMTLVLLQEADKENKIKLNKNNVINYLYSEDLWKSAIYNNDKFKNNLDELKSMNFHINQIIPLYEELGKDIDKNFFDDVKGELNEEKPVEEEEEEEEEEEKEDKNSKREEEKETDNEGEEEEEEEGSNDRNVKQRY